MDQKITTDLFILSSKKVSKMSPSLLFPILTFSPFLWQGDQKYTSVIKGKVEGCWGYCLQFEGTNFACKSLYVQTFLWSLEFAIFKISRAWHYLASTSNRLDKVQKIFLITTFIHDWYLLRWNWNIEKLWEFCVGTNHCHAKLSFSWYVYIFLINYYRFPINGSSVFYLIFF